jgi:4a-hydroxytetrahydrobiopterin dehydratase
MTDATARPITPRAFEDADGLADWRVLGDGAACFFRTASFAESARFVAALGEDRTIAGHPPAVDVRHDGVTLRVVTATDGHFGMTEQDVEVARAIGAVAQRMGLVADPAVLQSVLIVPGATDVDAVFGFWRAVLGYDPRPDSPLEDLVDPHDRGPAFWFETMDEPRADGGGAIHVGVFVPHELAEARVEAALAAGGRMVRSAFAPHWWTLADAAGNEADIGVIRDRG